VHGYRCVGRTASVLHASSSGRLGEGDDLDWPLEIPTKFELSQRPDKQKPLVRVRLAVHYRVHSRQMLCIGGSQIPLGWSFLSIAKVPMTWNSGDVWTCEVGSMRALGGEGCLGLNSELEEPERAGPHAGPPLAIAQVELQAGQRIEYKYVILEEQVRGGEQAAHLAG
jgi:hypothetical protein